MPSLTSGGLVKQSVVLTAELLTKVDDIAGARQQSRSDVIRDLLGRGLKHLAEEQRRLRQLERQKVSA